MAWYDGIGRAAENLADRVADGLAALGDAIRGYAPETRGRRRQERKAERARRRELRRTVPGYRKAAREEQRRQAQLEQERVRRKAERERLREERAEQLREAAGLPGATPGPLGPEGPQRVLGNEDVMLPQYERNTFSDGLEALAYYLDILSDTGTDRFISLAYLNGRWIVYVGES